MARSVNFAVDSRSIVFGSYGDIEVFRCSKKRSKRQQLFLDRLYHQLWMSVSDETYDTGHTTITLSGDTPTDHRIWFLDNYLLGDTNQSLSKLTRLYNQLQWSPPQPKLSYEFRLDYDLPLHINAVVTMGPYCDVIPLPYYGSWKSRTSFTYSVSGVTENSVHIGYLKYTVSRFDDDVFQLTTSNDRNYYTIPEEKILSQDLVNRRILAVAFRDETHFGAGLADVLCAGCEKI